MKKQMNYFKIENRIYEMAKRSEAFNESLLKEILDLIVEREAVQQELNHLRHHVSSRRLQTRRNKAHYDEALRTIDILEFELTDLVSGIQELRGLKKEAKRIYKEGVM